MPKGPSEAWKISEAIKWRKPNRSTFWHVRFSRPLAIDHVAKSASFGKQKQTDARHDSNKFAAWKNGSPAVNQRMPPDRDHVPQKQFYHRRTFVSVAFQRCIRAAYLILYFIYAATYIGILMFLDEFQICRLSSSGPAARWVGIMLYLVVNGKTLPGSSFFPIAL